MKKYIITGAFEVAKDRDYTALSMRVGASGGDDMQVSDGYHTMDELYDHRIQLFIALCRFIRIADGYADEADAGGKAISVWRSKPHADGSSFDGWFILGLHKEVGKQITYHLPIARWNDCDFAETLEKGPEFDGHTSADVLARLADI